jgi:hypothetical protein
VALLRQEGRLYPARNRLPAVQEEDFHGVVVACYACQWENTCRGLSGRPALPQRAGQRRASRHRAADEHRHVLTATEVAQGGGQARAEGVGAEGGRDALAGDVAAVGASTGWTRGCTKERTEGSGGKRTRDSAGWPGCPPALRPVDFLTTGLGASGGLAEGGSEELEAFWPRRASRSRTVCSSCATRSSSSAQRGQVGTVSLMTSFYQKVPSPTLAGQK